ncbi:hypothetical protein [Nocardia terpenica]|uniref:Uncharacterized protein n=1 Tax=Nocardia terpenica TaxID=455432 RepID=A0A291RNS5_9NOCA|nr:hypothetical protein [Nocardia terpenica]ATL68938.1 hypothetical protein CRH09_24895 [Nocardia terpenica]
MRTHRIRTAVVGGALAAALLAPLAAIQAASAQSPTEPNVTDMWTVPTIAPDRLTLIIAYSFGNRIPAGADPERTEGEPGPVNEALAAAVVAARGDRAIPVYAQTPIADVLRARYGLTDVVPLAADRRPDGTLAYLSTDGAAAKVAALRGPLVAGDTAGVIAFADHRWRATRTTAAHGFRAYAPAGIAVPDRYDPESGQPWTRSRIAYLPTDYAARIPLLINGIPRP